MKMNEIREMTDPELDRLFEELQVERLNLQIQAKTGQLQNSARIRRIRRDIARIKTEKTNRAAQPAETN